jgi:hypothetical protein
MDAANELDEVAHGRLAHSASAQRLASLLSESFRATDPVEIKSGTVAVFCQAIESLPGGPTLTNYPELIAKALEYAKELDSAQASGENSSLESMKNFCLALARASASYRRPVEDKQSKIHWR